MKINKLHLTIFNYILITFASIYLNFLIDINFNPKLIINDYAAGIPINVFYSFGIIFSLIKYLTIFFALFCLIEYIEKVTTYLKNKVLILKIILFLILTSSFINNIYPNLFRHPILNEPIGLNFFDFFSIFLILHIFTKFNLKSQFFDLFKIENLLSFITAVAIINLLIHYIDGIFEIFFLDEFLYNFFILNFFLIYYLISYFWKNYYLLSIPFIFYLKFKFILGSTVLIFPLFSFIFLFLNNKKFLKVYSLFIFLFTFVIPNYGIGHASNFNFLGEGLESVILLLSNEYSFEYIQSFHSFMKVYVQSLIPLKFFSFNLLSININIYFFRFLIILLTFGIIYKILGYKYLILFLPICFTNTLNIFPTDYYAPWTHEFRTFATYLFILNFINYICNPQKNLNILFLSFSSFLFLLSGPDLAIAFWGIVLAISILKITKKFNFFEQNSNKNPTYDYFSRTINFFIVGYVFLTISIIFSIIFMQSHNNFIILLIFLLLILKFYFLYYLIKNFKRKILTLFISFFIFCFTFFLFRFYNYYDLEFWTAKFEFLKLSFGYDEIARNYKPSAALINDYFATGEISEKLQNLINSFSSYSTFSNNASENYHFLIFDLKSFIFYYSHYIFLSLIFIKSYFLFTKKNSFMKFFDNKKYKVNLNFVIILFLLIIFISLLIKYFLIPDLQRYLFAIRFYHLALFIFFGSLIKYYFDKKLNKILLIIVLFCSFQNLFFYKGDFFYTKGHFNKAQSFSYETDLKSEIYSIHKSFNFNISSNTIYKDPKYLVDLTERMFGKSVYDEMKVEFDAFNIFKMNKKIENVKINKNMWTKKKIINNYYLEQ
jgi:hypothetical protein